jgi:drug/metabolite transporter (DMT)-like permease
MFPSHGLRAQNGPETLARAGSHLFGGCCFRQEWICRPVGGFARQIGEHRAGKATSGKLRLALRLRFHRHSVRNLPLSVRKYLVILSMVFFGASGDALLARGMKKAGAIDIHHMLNIFAALANPYILLGIVSLLIFMWSYMTAVSFADLSYVMPATAISYVLMTLLSIFWLHERVGAERWSGILFIVTGVGLVAGGPWRSGDRPAAAAGIDAAEERR